jgi:hypothetical protein
VQFLRAKKSFGSAGALPSRKKPFAICYSPFAVHHSPFAAVLPVANRQSPFAAVLARQEPRPPNSFRPPVPRPTTRSVSVPCPVPMVTNLFGEGGEGDANEGA